MTVSIHVCPVNSSFSCTYQLIHHLLLHHKTDLATEKQHTKGRFIQQATTNSKTERFVDELKEGVLIHAKTTVPAETFSREKMCKLKAPSHCLVGIPCPDNLPFSDALHKDNVFHNEKGEFCNCWMNRKVDTYWLPKLRDALRTW